MADDVTIASRTYAADDVGGVLHQRVKLSLGVDGVANDAVAGAGAVGTGVQRVTLASDDPVTTAVQIMDDWDESDRAKVNLIVGQAGIAAGAGAVGATVPRVTLASDDPVTTAVQIMDDWDESDRAKVNPIVGQAGVAGNTGTVGATTQRVTLATDVALPAGELHLGEVGGNATIITPSLTVDTSAYNAGDVVGGILTLTSAVWVSGGNGTLESVLVVDVDQEESGFHIYIFDRNPSNGTYTDNNAFTLDATDATYLIGQVSVVTGDYAVAGGVSVAEIGNIGKIVKASGSANLFAIVVAVDTPTYTAGTDVTIRFGFARN